MPPFFVAYYTHITLQSSAGNIRHFLHFRGDGSDVVTDAIAVQPAKNGMLLSTLSNYALYQRETDNCGYDTTDS